MDSATSEKLVYEAFKNIFGGENSNIRQSKKIKTLIQEHSEEPAIASLLQSQGVANLSNAVRRLLVDEIFICKTKAEERFDQAAVQPSTSTQHKTCPTVVPGLNPPPGGCLSHASSDTGFFTKPGLTLNLEPSKTTVPKVPSLGSRTATCQKPAQEPAASARIGNNTVLTTLPYYAQYHLLTLLQQCLEMACLDFSRGHFPAVLKENNWSCWEAAELNLFVKELAKQPTRLPRLTEVVAKIPLTKLLESITELRHSAVHRHCLTASDIKTFIDHSRLFLTLLADDVRAEVLKSWSLNILHCLTELDDHELEATQTLQHVQNQIEARRVELKRQEQAALVKAEKTRLRFREEAALKVLGAIKISQPHGKTEERIAMIGGRGKSLLIELISGIWMAAHIVMRPIGAAAAAIAFLVLKLVSYY